MDRLARDGARLSLDSNVVVVAGAGTGKTTLLTDRIIFNLLGRQPALPVTAVVALTFTEKAAGEIRLRLSERLLDVMALLSGGALEAMARARAEVIVGELRLNFKRTDAEIGERCRAALEDMDKAQIGTIHSFAAHLLRLYPLQAGVDPGFRVDEGLDFDELFATQWAAWLDAELGEAAAGSRRKEWLEVLHRAPLEDLAALARGLCREGVDLSVAGRPDPATARRLSDMVRVLSSAGLGQPPPRGNSRIAEALSCLCAHVEKLAAAAAQADPPLTRPCRCEAPRAQWPSGWDQSARAVYEDAQKIADCASAGNEALARRALRLLAPFAESFRRTYTRGGLVSFDGLLLKARDLVRDHPSVREELKARYETFLVDEFQDTDPLQGELLLLLCEVRGGRAGRWDQVQPGPGRLFLVGDPKQSIYRFRGADIAAYQSFVAHLLADKKTVSCELKTNFRSTAAVLAAVNAIFPRLMRHKPGSQPEYLAIAPREGLRDGGAAVEAVIVEAPDALTSQKTEAAWVSSWILRHCGEPGSERGRASGRLRFKDMAVLMRTSSALSSILDAFKAAGIPYVVEMEKLFYGAQEIIDLLNLLRVLDDPEDRVSMAGLLRSPLLGLRDADLGRLFQAGSWNFFDDPPHCLAAEERRRLGGVFVLLRRLRGRVGRIPLGEFVHAVIQETPLLEAAARAYHGQQSVSNLLKFARMASTAADERGMTLKEFIGVVACAMSESRAEGESPLADEHLDAVRILSIHKAKGLEFPVVFLTNLSGASGRAAADEAVLVDWQTGRAGLRLPKTGAADAVRADLEAQERLRQADESVRLLYVALTRAKDRLFLLGRERADKGTLAQLLREAGAWPCQDDDAGAEGEKFSPGVGIKVHRVRAGEGESLHGIGRRAGLKPEHRLPPKKALERLWQERLKRRDAAASLRWTRSATEYLQRAQPGPDEEKSAMAPSHADSADGALVGQVCHRVLAGWDFRGAADPARGVVEACRALSHLEPDADWEAVRRQSEEVLRTFLGSAAARELADVEILGRELPFVYGEDGAVVRGVIDLVYQKGRRVVVADYKSEAIAAGSLKRLRDKYRGQGEAYKAAVEKAWGCQDAEFRLIFLRQPDWA